MINNRERWRNQKFQFRISISLIDELSMSPKERKKEKERELLYKNDSEINAHVRVGFIIGDERRKKKKCAMNEGKCEIKYPMGNFRLIHTCHTYTSLL